MRVAVLDDYHHAFRDLPAIARMGNHPDIEEVRILTEAAESPQALAQRVGDCQILIAIRERTRFSAELLALLPALRLIAQTGNHAYHIDVEAATRQGIAVGFSSAPSGGSQGAAELTIGLMLALMRRIPYYDGLVHRGGWEVPFGRVLAGKTLGLLGLGKVGRQVARLAGAFDMQVLAWSRTLTAEQAKRAGARRTELEDLLRRSDVVSVHLTLAPESRGLLNRERLSWLRPDAILINTARGPIVEEPALVELLQSRRIAGAGLDVFDEEPLPAHHPFMALENVVLTPHIGWPTDSAYHSFADAAVGVIEHFLSGNMEDIVNPDALVAGALRPKSPSRAKKEKE